MKTKAAIKRAAIKRDPAIPMGEKSPLHVDCECGQAVSIIEPINECSLCHTDYDLQGWTIGEGLNLAPSASNIAWCTHNSDPAIGCEECKPITDDDDAYGEPEEAQRHE